MYMLVIVQKKRAAAARALDELVQRHGEELRAIEEKEETQEKERKEGNGDIDYGVNTLRIDDSNKSDVPKAEGNVDASCSAHLLQSDNATTSTNVKEQYNGMKKKTKAQKRREQKAQQEVRVRE